MPEGPRPLVGRLGRPIAERRACRVRAAPSSQRRPHIISRPPPPRRTLQSPTPPPPPLSDITIAPPPHRTLRSLPPPSDITIAPPPHRTLRSHPPPSPCGPLVGESARAVFLSQSVTAHHNRHRHHMSMLHTPGLTSPSPSHRHLYSNVDKHNPSSRLNSKFAFVLQLL